MVTAFSGIDDLFDVTSNSELEDVAVNWRGIGLALRLHNPENCYRTKGRIVDCVRDMLEFVTIDIIDGTVPCML